MKKSKKNWDFSRYYPLLFTIIFVIILFQYSFSKLESIFYDFRVKIDTGIGHKDNIVLIALDEESDEFLGESFPYSYTTHVRLFKRLRKDNPKVISYLLNLSDIESSLDQRMSDEFTKEVEGYVSEGGFFQFGTDMDAWGEQLPPDNLRSLGYSLSLLNVDNGSFSRDDVCRRAILNISGEESFHLKVANEFRQSKSQPPLTISDIWGSYYVKEADASFTLFRYYTSPNENNGRVKRIPFHRVVVGNFPKGFFSNKIVLIGSQYISNSSDYILTPFNKESFTASKLMIHAQIIQSLIQNKTILQVPRSVTYILAILIAVFLSITISRVRPTRGLFITLMVMLGIVLASIVLFSYFGLWVYLTHLILTVFVVYYIWVPFRAIGEYQRRYAIQEETKLLKRVENLKQNFISLMSHDLKTPVAKIAGLADNLKNQLKDRADVHKNLDSIVDSTKELNKFITSILDLTKIESRNLTLNLTSKDVNKILEHIIETLRYESKNKNIEIVSELSPLYPIKFDQELMKRVFSNLIENAIKYSGEESQISVKTWDDEKWVYVEIKDNGVGIPPDDLKYIFEKFYRVKNDASHMIKGTGLGLYLVKYFVELHGGTIEASSEVGQGTSFLVKLKNE